MVSAPGASLMFNIRSLGVAVSLESVPRSPARSQVECWRLHRPEAGFQSIEEVRVCSDCVA